MGMVFSINPTASKTQAMFKTMAVAQNGTGIQSAIQGGTPSDSGSGTAAASAVSSPAAAAAAAPSVASGMGSTAGDGTCSCSCLCGQAAFPEAAMQGVGMFGGMSGKFLMLSFRSYKTLLPSLVILTFKQVRCRDPYSKSNEADNRKSASPRFTLTFFNIPEDIPK